MFGHRSRLPFDPSLGILVFGPDTVQLCSSFVFFFPNCPKIFRVLLYYVQLTQGTYLSFVRRCDSLFSRCWHWLPCPLRGRAVGPSPVVSGTLAIGSLDWECCALQWSAEKILIWVGSGAGLPGRPEMIISTLCMCQHVRPVATCGKPSSGSKRWRSAHLRSRAMARLSALRCCPGL